MKCPVCGKQVGTWKSLLGGRAINWHKPKKGTNTFGKVYKSGQCIGSGTVLNEPQ